MATMTATTANFEPPVPQEMAIPGTHASVMRLITRTVPPSKGTRVLDVGAGQGSLSLRLLEAGYEVSACDLDPDLFQLRGIECRAVDAVGALPYESQSFDLVVCVEVVEHLESHRRLFVEVRRLLRRQGRLIFTTPNILSLKSRMTFLLSGYYYSFPPLVPQELAPQTQHISPFTLDRYRWALRRCGLEIVGVATDKFQRSSLCLIPLWPLVKLYGRVRWGGSRNLAQQNSPATLFGRTLFISAQSHPSSGDWADDGRDAG